MIDEAHEEPGLRDLLTRAAARFEPLDGPAVRAAADHRNRRAGVGRVVLPAAAALVVAGIAMIAAVVSHHASPAAGPAVTAPRTHAAPSPTGSRTSTGPDQAFQVRLVLPGTSFPADGQPIHAYVRAVNHTGRPIVIHDACDGWVQAGLTGEHTRFEVFNGLVRCASETIPPGTTRIRVTIPTTYTGCLQGKQPGTLEDPHCLGPHDSRPPNLPAGTYRAEVATQSTSIRPVLSKPQQVTLTAVG